MSQINIKVGANAYMNPDATKIYLRHVAGAESAGDFPFERPGALLGRVTDYFVKKAYGKDITFVKIARPFYDKPLYVMVGEMRMAEDLKPDNVVNNLTTADANVWKNLELMRRKIEALGPQAPASSIQAYNELAARYAARQNFVKSSGALNVIRNTAADIKKWAGGKWDALLASFGLAGIGALPILALPIVVKLAGVVVAGAVVYAAFTYWIDHMRGAELDHVRSSDEYNKLANAYPGAEKDLKKVSDESYDAGKDKGKEQANSSIFGGALGKMLLPLAIVGGGLLLLSKRGGK